MKIISFNQKWIFKNELKNIPEQTVDLPHDAMLTEKRLPEGKAGAAGAIEKTCSGQKSTGTNQFI